jgi:PII-like signaling protein
MGIGGGTALRAVAGFGRHGRLHEEAFFELAGDLPVEIEFLVSTEQAEQLLVLLKTESLRLFYVAIPAEYGITE